MTDDFDCMVVVDRCEETPNAPVESEKRLCDECGRTVWYARSTKESLKEKGLDPERVKLVCIPCFKMPNDCQVLPLGKAQVIDIVNSTKRRGMH